MKFYMRVCKQFYAEYTQHRQKSRFLVAESQCPHFGEMPDIDKLAYQLSLSEEFIKDVVLVFSPLAHFSDFSEN